MYLDRIEDHRSSLEKATRMELFRFAQANNVTDIVHEMPASLMRKKLRERGLTNIRIPHRVLGAPPQGRGVEQHAMSAPSTSIDADEDLERQWRSQAPPPPPEKPRATRQTATPAPVARKRLVERPKSEINKLRDECKRLGVKMERRDRTDDLKRKIEAHLGQNAAQ